MPSIHSAGSGPIVPPDGGLPDEATDGLTSELFQGDAALEAVLRGDDRLTRGDRGAGLLKVQRALRQIGHGLYKFGADGRWHNEFRESLLKFQAAHGLDQSGVVDSATLRALDQVLATGADALDGAARDGRITSSELKRAEEKMAAVLGPEKARTALIAALGQDPARIDFKAIDYLQGRIGSMDGHIDRYQQVLAGHLENAKLLDANFDGRLDANDLVFTKDAAGKVNVERIGQALCDRVKIGGAMVDAAHDLAKADARFGGMEFNEAAWEFEDPDEDYEYGMGVMVPASGIPPSVALRDIFNNPDLYQFECATALTIVRYKAILDLIGDNDFDRICSDLRLGPWEAEDDTSRAWKVSGRAKHGDEIEASGADIALVKPGEYSYFRNWDVSKAGFEGGWQGENVIYLGEGMYYGHPFGVIAGEEIVAHLNENRKRGSTRSASLMDLRARIDPSVLKHDRDPYG